MGAKGTRTKIFVGILAVLLLGAAAASPAPQAGTAQAEQLILRGRLDEAEALLRRIIASDDDPRAKYLLGFALIQKYRYEEAEQHLRQAIAQQPDQPEWLHALAKALIDQGRNAAALEVLDRALALDPKPAYHFAKAMSALNIGDLVLGEAELKASLKTEDNPEALYRLAQIQVDGGDYESAETQLRRALELDPNHLEAHFLLGLALSRTGQHEPAAQQFQTVLSRVPAHVGALYNLGRTLMRLGRADEGKRRLEQFRQASQQQDQIEFYERGVRKNPDNLEGRILLSRLMLKAGRTQDALSHLLTARRQQPNRVETYQLLAQAFLRLGRKEDAEKALQFARQLSGAPR